MLHNGELEGDNVLIVHPVLCSASDKSVLASAGRRITLDRVTTSTDQVEQLGQLDYEVVIVHSVKRMVLEVFLVKGLFE